MPENDELSKHEEKLKEIWANVLRNTKRDLAYIWSKEVKKDLKELREEDKKIAQIFSKLRLHYSPNKWIYEKEISDLRNLLSHLKKVEAREEWIHTIHDDLADVIKDIDREGGFFRQLTNKVLNPFVRKKG
ncbi:hypothetical protein KY366_00670 [Candidatus Woesearchaeota archaeon]|nr:hypothetical protein [Candidatus Woesearchaeota archaeon]